MSVVRLLGLEMNPRERLEAHVCSSELSLDVIVAISFYFLAFFLKMTQFK